MAEPRIVLISDDGSITEKVVQKLNSVELPTQVLIDNPMEIGKRIPGAEPVVVILVQQSTTLLSIEEICQEIHSANPISEIVFIQKYANHTITRELVRSGIADILLNLDDADQLVEMIQNAIRTLKNKIWEKGRTYTPGPQRESGIVYSVYSAKGGSGKTLIASNLAQALRLASNKKVLLIDLNLQFGGIQAALNINNGRSITELAPVIYELNIAQIDNISVYINSGLQILLGPRNPEQAEIVNVDFVSILLKTCRQYFDYIVVDLPSYINDVSLTGITQADKTLYVVSPDTPAIEAMRKALEIFSRYGITLEKKISLVVNRVSSKNEITLNDLERITPLKIDGTIHADFSAIQSHINMGRPLFESLNEKRQSKIVKDIIKMTKALMV